MKKFDKFDIDLADGKDLYEISIAADGKKYIRIWSYYWINETSWSATTASVIYLPLEKFLGGLDTKGRAYINELWECTKQYQDDNLSRSYVEEEFEEKDIKPLLYTELTMDTENGFYVDCKPETI